MKKPYLKKNNEQGFSLIEFIVVLVIFSIMSGTSLFNFNKYQNNIEQTNIAQDIALTLRQAQVYGLSGSDQTVGAQDLDEQGIASDVFGVDGDDNQFFGDTQILNIANDRSVRGVAIDTDGQRLIIFEDINRSLEYEPDTDRVIDVRTILARDVFMSVCLIHEDDVPQQAADCSSSNNATTVVSQEDLFVNITFQRPYPDAILYFDNEEDYRYAYIELKDRSGNNLRYVEVSPIGNISVKSYE